MAYLSLKDINKIYPNGTSTTKISVELNTYYQVDASGTSYVFKLAEIGSTLLSCKVEYKEFKDEEYYSYFRSIKSKLDSSLKESSSSFWEKLPSVSRAAAIKSWALMQQRLNSSTASIKSVRNSGLVSTEA